MRHARDPNELLEVLGDKLRAIVRNDSWLGIGKLLTGALQQDLHFRLGHRFPQGPIDDVAAGSVQHRAQIVERRMDIDIGNVDVPMLVWSQGLNKSSSFFAGPLIPFLQPACLTEHAPHTGRTHGNDVGIDHPVSQPPVSFIGVERLKVQDLFLLPRV